MPLLSRLKLAGRETGAAGPWFADVDSGRGTRSRKVPSFQSVYREYFDFVWSSARRLGVAPDAIDDLVQEVFIVIHAKLHTLEKPEALRSWIYGVVRRTVSLAVPLLPTSGAVGGTTGAAHLAIWGVTIWTRRSGR